MLDANTAIKLLENKRTVDEQNRLAPAQSFVQGAMAGVQNRMTENADTKKRVSENKFKLWQETLKKYDLTDLQGNPLDATTMNTVNNFIAQHDDLPPGIKLNPVETMTYGTDKEGKPTVTGRIPKGAVNLTPKEERTNTRKQDPYQFKINRLKAMGDDLDSDKNVNNAYGIAQKGFDRSKRLEALVSRYPDMNLDQRETEELAIGLNSILSGSNQSAQEQVKSLVPKSVIGNAMKLKEWLTNNPQGLQQQTFIKRMYNDVQREAETMHNQLLDKASKKIAKYNDILNNMDGLDEQEKLDLKQQYNDIMESRGISVSGYEKWKKEGFKPKSVIPENPNTTQDNQSGGLPQVGQTFQGGKVLSIKRID